MSDRVGEALRPARRRSTAGRVASRMTAARVCDSRGIRSSSGRVLQPDDRHVPGGVDGELRVPGVITGDVEEIVGPSGSTRRSRPGCASAPRWRCPCVARVVVDDPCRRRLPGGLITSAGNEIDWIVPRGREVVIAAPRSGCGRVATRVHDGARRVLPDHDDVAEASTATAGPSRSSPAIELLASTPASRSCRPGRTRRPARGGETWTRDVGPVRARPHDRAEPGRAQREDSARSRPRPGRRGSSRRSTAGPGACDATWTRTFVPSVRSQVANVSPAASDATSGSARGSARRRDREILRREPGRSRRSRRGERDEQSRGEHEWSHDPEHVESLTLGKASRQWPAAT